MNEKKKKFALQYNCRANLILMFLEWRLMEHTLTKMFLEWRPMQHTFTTNVSRVVPGATHIDNKCFSSSARCNTH